VTPRSVVDLLAEQPEEALRAMRERAAVELARLSVEVRQIDEAIAKKARKSRASGSKRLTREQVLDAVIRADRPVTAAEVYELLSAEGVATTPNSVRNHLLRLVELHGALEKTGEGNYLPTAKAFLRSPTDDDIPF
jgi:hypothetical protein